MVLQYFISTQCFYNNLLLLLYYYSSKQEEESSLFIIKLIITVIFIIVFFFFLFNYFIYYCRSRKKKKKEICSVRSGLPVEGLTVHRHSWSTKTHTEMECFDQQYMRLLFKLLKVKKIKNAWI